MRKLIFLLLLVVITFNRGISQEFNVKVKVQTPKLKLADPKVFTLMEKSISEFFNNTTWTSDDFEDNEKIEANLLINITNEFSATSFVANFSFQCVRPVYNSNYKTVTFNWIDDGFSFDYEELQPIDLSTTVFIDDLSAILTYYGYFMLGMDYDSFSTMGGDKYFDKAREVVDNVPLTNQNIKSWHTNGKKENKYWLIDYTMNPKFRNYRQSFYEYHRLGLDVMYQDPEKGRAIVISALKEVKKLAESFPQNSIVRLFINNKKDEIIEIFKGAGYAQRNSVYTLMSDIDPSGIEDYKDIIR